MILPRAEALSAATATTAEGDLTKRRKKMGEWQSAGVRSIGGAVAPAGRAAAWTGTGRNAGGRA